jgi:hypothetical protein
VVVRVDGLFDEGLGDLGVADAQELLRLLKVLVARRCRRERLDAARVAAHAHVARHRDARLHQRVVNRAAVKQQVLHRHVVHHVGWLDASDVCLRLCERKAVGLEADEALHHRPALDGLVQDDVVAEDDNLWR